MQRTDSNRAGLWTKDFILICLTGFFLGIGVQMLNSTLAPFANDMWGSKSLGGYLTSFFNLGSILMAFVCSPTVNRFGRKRCLIGAALLFSVPTAFCVFFPTPAVTLTARVFQGMSKGLSSVAAASIVADISPEERMSEAVGLYGLGDTMGMAAGPFLGLLLSSKSYQLMFAVCALIYGSAILTVSGISYECGVSRAEKTESKGSTYRGIWKLIEKKALPASINYAVAFASYACVLIFISVFSQEILGMTALQISPFYLTAAITMAVVRLFGGRIADQHGPLYLVIPGELASILLMVLLLFYVDKGYVIYLLCGGLFGIAHSAIMPALMAVAITRSPPERSSAASGAFYFLMDVGVLCVATFFGPLIDAFDLPVQGYNLVFGISIGVGMIAVLMSLLICPRHMPEKTNTN